MYRNFFKTWPQLCHGIYHTGILKQRGHFDIAVTSLFIPPSKPSQGKLQRYHLKFTWLFDFNRILVFYIKILLSNSNKIETVKLLIVYESVLSLHLFGIFLPAAALLVITQIILLSTTWGRKILSKQPCLGPMHMPETCPHRDTSSTAVSAMPAIQQTRCRNRLAREATNNTLDDIHFSKQSMGSCHAVLSLTNIVHVTQLPLSTHPWKMFAAEECQFPWQEAPWVVPHCALLRCFLSL